MAQHNWIKKSLGVALLLAGGIFFGSMTEVYATEEAPAPKSIKLGVDPDQYLKNRHRRVNRARNAANARNTYNGVKAPDDDIPPPRGSGLNPNTPEEYAGAPGFNEFSYLSDAEKGQAEEIMKFLKNFQGQ